MTETHCINTFPASGEADVERLGDNASSVRRMDAQESHEAIADGDCVQETRDDKGNLRKHEKEGWMQQSRSVLRRFVMGQRCSARRKSLRWRRTRKGGPNSNVNGECRLHVKLYTTV